MQVFNPFSSGNSEIDQTQFAQMVREGDITHYTIVSNRNKVRVKLTDAGLKKWEKEVGKNAKASDDYHASFTIASVESFKDEPNIVRIRANIFCRPRITKANSDS